MGKYWHALCGREIHCPSCLCSRWLEFSFILSLRLFRAESGYAFYIIIFNRCIETKGYKVQETAMNINILGSLSTRSFETRTATGSEQFSLLTWPHTTTFTLRSIFLPLEMNSTKIWETMLS